MNNKSNRSLINSNILLATTLIVFIFFGVTILMQSCSRCTRRNVENLIDNNKDITRKQIEESQNDTINFVDSYPSNNASEEINEKKTERKESFSNFWEGIKWIIFIVVFFTIIYLIHSISVLKKKLKPTERKVKRIYEDYSEYFTKQLSNKNEAECNQKLSALEERVEIIEGKIKNNDAPNTDLSNITHVEKDEKDNQTNNRYQKYFPPPNRNKYFLKEDESGIYREQTDFYMFIINRNDPGEAELFFIENEHSAKRAINYYSGILETACEVENLFMDNPTKITTIKPGKVILEGNKWKIIEKSIVKYE